MVPSYSGTPCFLARETGLVQSLVPLARPIKFATPRGAVFGNRVQWRSPAVVWIMAVGSVLAGAAGFGAGVVGAFGVEAACAAPKIETEIIRTRVCNKVRMDAPEGILANVYCTTSFGDGGWQDPLYQDPRL